MGTWASASTTFVAMRGCSTSARTCQWRVASSRPRPYWIDGRRRPGPPGGALRQWRAEAARRPSRRRDARAVGVLPTRWLGDALRLVRPWSPGRRLADLRPLRRRREGDAVRGSRGGRRGGPRGFGRSALERSVAGDDRAAFEAAVLGQLERDVAGRA